MNKILLTLCVCAFINIVAKAQDPTKHQPAKKDSSSKEGTRMAINEKGTSGTKASTTKNDNKKERKSEKESTPTSGTVNKQN